MIVVMKKDCMKVCEKQLIVVVIKRIVFYKNHFVKYCDCSDLQNCCCCFVKMVVVVIMKMSRAQCLFI